MRDNYWLRKSNDWRMGRRRLLQAGGAGAIGAAGFAIVGCGNDDDNGDASTNGNGNGNGGDTTNGGRPEPEGEARVAIAADFQAVEPPGRLGGQDLQAIQQMFESLVTRDAAGNLVGGLAEDWEALEEGSVYQFTIRDGVQFHNGETMTAEDVKFSFDLIDEVEYMRATLPTFESCEVIDDSTVQVNLSQRDGGFPFLLDGFHFIVPQAYIDEVGLDGFGRDPVGTGPFQYANWDPGSRFEAEVFHDYWGEKAMVERLRLDIVGDDSTRLNMLQTGEAHIIAAVPPNQLEAIEGDLQVVQVPSGSNTFIHFQLITPERDGPIEDSPLSDQRVRLAINHAIDRDAIVDRILYGTATPMADALGEGMLGHDPGVEPYAYDPDRAEELLAEAGYGDGLELNFIYDSSPASQAQGQAITDFLEAVGITVTQEAIDGQTLTQRRREQNLHDMYISGYPDYSPDPVSRWQGGLVPTGTYVPFYDEQMVEYLDQVVPLSDPDERAEVIREAFDHLYEEAWIGFLWHPDAVWGLGNNVEWSPMPNWLYFRNSNTIRLNG